jgi:hypothetical protein
MLVQFKPRHPAFRRINWPSFAGEGMAVRLRSMSFALFGAGALFGLLLVAILAQPSLSLLPALPIPGVGSGGEAVSNASVAAHPILPATGADLAGSHVRSGPASVAPTEHHRRGSHSTPTPAPGASSPLADGTPVEPGADSAPVVNTPEPTTPPAPEPATPTTVAVVPVATPSGESSRTSNPIAAGADTGHSSSGKHGHQPGFTRPSHGHQGKPSAPSSRPPSGPEAMPETDATVPAEGYESSSGDHGHGHGHGHSDH